MQIEASLVEAAKGGDSDAFESLVRQTHRAVYGLVYRIVGNHDDAADVMQETYLRLWRGLRSFRGDAAFGTWVYRVAANAAISHVKKRRGDDEPVDPASIAELEPAPIPDGEGPAAEDLERALARLPVAQRTVVVLKDVYGFPLAEIAKQVGSTEGAVKVRLFRARKRLAEDLYASGVVVPMKKKRKASS